MTPVPDQEARIAAALRGAAAAAERSDPAGGDPAGGDPSRGNPEIADPGAASSHAVADMLAVAESIVERGGLDIDDLRRRQLSQATGTALLLRVLPFGLATPLDRPRLRRDAYRCAAAAGADEGTALVCVAAALVAADLLRFDPVTTATRVRQSLLEDAPMALLNRLTVLEPGSEITEGEADPGAALQVALSVLEWTDCAGVAAVLARLGEGGGHGDVATLAAALAGAVTGACDVQVGGEVDERAGRVAAELASLGAAAVQ